MAGSRPILLRGGGRQLPFAALFLAGLLAVELAYDWSPGTAAPATTDNRDEIASAAGWLSELLGPAPEIDDFLAAPVLDPDRSPIQRTGRAAGGSVAGNELRLLGTVISGNGGIAIFSIEGEVGIIRAGPGDSVGDWRVVDLQSQRVRLERAGEMLLLTLQDAGEGER